ncbi:hypothetical protein [Sphingomonas sp. HMP9]|nr:hypothetical protein [Sphingomonas sp. HMP9]
MATLGSALHAAIVQANMDATDLRKTNALSRMGALLAVCAHPSIIQ